MKITVILAAGGSGTRIGCVNKGLISLLGRPALMYSGDLFLACPQVTQIIVAARSEDIADITRICAGWRDTVVVAGGADRTSSVRNALAVANPDSTHIAIHDAARPLLHAEDWSALIDTITREQAVILASPLVDTVKRVSPQGYVTATLPREQLCAVATPQIFTADVLHHAYASDATATDDAALVENLGIPVHVVMARHDNFKLTYVGDILHGEAVLRARNKGGK